MGYLDWHGDCMNNRIIGTRGGRNGGMKRLAYSLLLIGIVWAVGLAVYLLTPISSIFVPDRGMFFGYFVLGWIPSLLILTVIYFLVGILFLGWTVPVAIGVWLLVKKR